MRTVGRRQHRPVGFAAPATRLVEGVRLNDAIHGLTRDMASIAIAHHKDIAGHLVREQALAALNAHPENP